MKPAMMIALLATVAGAAAGGVMIGEALVQQCQLGPRPARAPPREYHPMILAAEPGIEAQLRR